MKPAIWRIFRNGRWSYSDSPSTRSEERAAWQPLYAVPEKEWVGLTAKDLSEIPPSCYEGAIWADAKLKEKNT